MPIGFVKKYKATRLQSFLDFFNLTAEAAKRAVDCGVSAILVSNHGGRILDGLPATVSDAWTIYLTKSVHGFLVLCLCYIISFIRISANNLPVFCNAVPWALRPWYAQSNHNLLALCWIYTSFKIIKTRFMLLSYRHEYMVVVFMGKVSHAISMHSNGSINFIGIELLHTAWASCQMRNIAGCACAGNAGNVFPRRQFQREPLVSDPGMHHGTCVTHVPWCMSGSLTCGDGESVPGTPGACAPAILRIWQEAHVQPPRLTWSWLHAGESVAAAIVARPHNHTAYLGPLLLTWFNFNPSMDK